MKRSIEDVNVDKIEEGRLAILNMLMANEFEADEALTMLSGMLVQFYVGLVQDQTREKFVDTLGQVYDTFELLSKDAHGSIQ